MRISRKTVMAVIAVIVAALTFLQSQFGLSAESVAAAMGLGAVALYIMFEAKLDVKRMAAQPGKWKDPKFWIALVTALIPVLNEELGLNLPTETIVAVLAAVLTFLFGLAFKKKPV